MVIADQSPKRVILRKSPELIQQTQLARADAECGLGFWVTVKGGGIGGGEDAGPEEDPKRQEPDGDVDVGGNRHRLGAGSPSIGE